VPGFVAYGHQMATTGHYDSLGIDFYPPSESSE